MECNGIRESMAKSPVFPRITLSLHADYVSESGADLRVVQMLLGYVYLSTTLKSVTHCSSCILVVIPPRAGIQDELSENTPGYEYTES